MILQNTLLAAIINGIPDIVSFILIILFFTFTVYIAAWILKLKDKSSFIDEKNFFIRTFLLIIVVGVIFMFFELLFVIMLFSPLFEQIPTDLMFAILDTRMLDILAEIIASDLAAQIMMVVVIVLITLVVSLAAMDAYHVPFLWSTLAIWTALMVYTGLELIIVFLINPDGVAGLLGSLGGFLRDLAWLAAFGEL